MSATATADLRREFFGNLIEESRERTPLAIHEGILPVMDVRIREDVFQHRAIGSEASRYHLADLTKALRNLHPDEDLEPITVWWSGRAWYCVDGHHRLKAYRAARPAARIPAKAFEGTLEEACVEALQANSHTKLPMSHRERKDAAWGMVRLDIGTKKVQRLSAGVSDGLIAQMRRVRRTLIDLKSAEPLPLSWWQAQQAAKGLELQPYSEEMNDEKVAEMAAKLAKTFGRTLSNKAHMFWDALERYDQNLYRQMRQMAKDEDQWDD